MTDGKILNFDAVKSAQLFGSYSDALLTFALNPGDLVLVDARDLTLASGLADLCCGLGAVESGQVHFMERDWARQSREQADALRGRIGRVLATPAWLPFLDATENILLGQAYHTRRTLAELRAEATGLAREFGLPGLPVGPIGQMNPDDLARAGFVRALLGNPRLILLESPIQGYYTDLLPVLLNRLADLRESGSAAIWLTRSRLVWDNRAFPATQRWRLDYAGLAALG